MPLVFIFYKSNHCLMLLAFYIWHRLNIVAHMQTQKSEIWFFHILSEPLSNVVLNQMHIQFVDFNLSYPIYMSMLASDKGTSRIYKKTKLFFIYIQRFNTRGSTMSLQVITNGIILVWAGINVNANISVLNKCKQKGQKSKICLKDKTCSVNAAFVPVSSLTCLFELFWFVPGGLLCVFIVVIGLSLLGFELRPLGCTQSSRQSWRPGHRHLMGHHGY